MGLAAYFPLVLRPAMLFWLALIALLNVALGGSVDTRPWLLYSLPFSLGLLVNGPIHDLLCREFSWTLPRIHAKLLAAFVVMGILIAIFAALAAPTPMPFSLEICYAFAVYAMTLGLDDPGQTLRRLRPIPSVVAWLALTLLGMRHADFMALLSVHDFWAYPLLLIIIAFFVWTMWAPGALRHGAFRPYLSILNAFNTQANVNYRSRLWRNGRLRHARWRLKPRGHKTWPLIAAAFYETNGGMRLFPLAVKFGLFAIAAAVGFGLIDVWIDPPFHMFYMGGTACLALNRPMLLSGAPLYPVSRRHLLRAEFATAFLEATIYALVPGLVCVIIGGLSISPIPLTRNSVLVLAFPETAGVSIALTLAFFPVIQWVRRRLGTHVMAFFSAVTLILLVSAGLLAFLTCGWPAGDALELWIVLGSLIVLGQLLFFLAIKGMLISGDLTWGSVPEAGSQYAHDVVGEGRANRA